MSEYCPPRPAYPGPPAFFLTLSEGCVSDAQLLLRAAALASQRVQAGQDWARYLLLRFADLQSYLRTRPLTAAQRAYVEARVKELENGGWVRLPPSKQRRNYFRGLR